jgi:hypothetical protein
MKINKLQRKGYEVTLELEEEFSEVEKEPPMFLTTW